MISQDTQTILEIQQSCIRCATCIPEGLFATCIPEGLFATAEVSEAQQSKAGHELGFLSRFGECGYVFLGKGILMGNPISKPQEDIWNIRELRRFR